jgi:hypothetical protein
VFFDYRCEMKEAKCIDDDYLIQNEKKKTARERTKRNELMKNKFQSISRDLIRLHCRVHIDRADSLS